MAESVLEETGRSYASPAGAREAQSPARRQPCEKVLNVAVLTGGWDKPYALGIGCALDDQDIALDFVGSDEMDGPELKNRPRLRFLNLKGDQNPKASRGRKVWRNIKYYWRLVVYAACAKPKIFHLLWNNKIELFDRTVLMAYYRLLGKKVVFTAHNVNTAKRDAADSFLNRLSLKIQYGLCHRIFVHTRKMKEEMVAEFPMPAEKVVVIPFGINNTLPNSGMTREKAREVLGLDQQRKTILFFGNIAPYKGLEHLVRALVDVSRNDPNICVLVAGRTKGAPEYWESVQREITSNGLNDKIILRTEYIPDEQVEGYFKAADVLVLPYVSIFQSGVLSLGYSFGLPVIAADVGSLKEEIVEGKTGLVFSHEKPSDLAGKIEAYFGSELYRDLERRRQDIRNYANEQYSWDKVGVITKEVYLDLLQS
jgi:glycosyltransferase involved in cell wall biosynthesis